MTGWFIRSPSALDELRAALRRDYPDLHVRVRDGTVFVEGGFAVLTGADGDDRYAICIELPEDYPNSQPDVWEVAGRIPRIIERHVFPASGALCLGVPLDVWIRLDGNFSIGTYLEKAVRPYLIGNSIVEEGGEWPFNESAHGSQGVLEFFERTMGASDPANVGRFLLAVLDGRVRGHWDCPCGSRRPLRVCHAEGLAALRRAPPTMLIHAIEHMAKLLPDLAPRNRTIGAKMAGQVE